MSNILSATAITRDFIDGEETLKVLTGIDLELKTGSSSAIMGPSGAGKSALLHILGGLDRPSGGSYFMDKQEIYKLTADELSDWRNSKIGFVFQYHQLLTDFNALENIMFPALIKGASFKVAQRRALSLMERLKIAERASHRVLKLSGGEQQRVAIARAMINNPQLILADEPTGSLDQTTGTEVINILLNFVAEANITLVVVTHNPDLAAKFNQIFQLQEGKIKLLA